MSQPALLRRVVQVLDDLEIPYMLTGSLASSMQGEPRATHDIDLVVALNRDSVIPLVEAFPDPDYYLDAESILDAITQDGMFNLIDSNEGDKVDFWLLTHDAWDLQRFSRRLSVPFQDITLCVSSPEDTILSKLRWSRLSGGSTRQRHDARSVLELHRSTLDQQYLRRWAEYLGVVEDLNALEAADR